MPRGRRVPLVDHARDDGLKIKTVREHPKRFTEWIHAREVDPRGVVELYPLERHLPVDRGRDVHDGQRSDACIERCQRVAA